MEKNKLNARMLELGAMPARIATLPIDSRGYPVPWFVAWSQDGKPCRRGVGEPDFRIVHPEQIAVAHNKRLCWICGGVMGNYKTFLIGPMCAVNRISSEPPSHRDCATFAARACPFLSQPRMRRNDKGLPEEKFTAGIAIMRNPGVSLVWTTRAYTPMKISSGVLFQIGEPTDLQWFAEGRSATRAEIMHSIETGLPTLREVARVKDGPEGELELERLIDRALALVPAA